MAALSRRRPASSSCRPRRPDAAAAVLLRPQPVRHPHRRLDGGGRSPSPSARAPSSPRSGAAASRPCRRASGKRPRSLALDFRRTLALVIIPQAVRMALPPTVGYMVQVVKGTSLAALIGFTELAKAGTQMNTITFEPIARLRHGLRSSISRCAGRCRCWRGISNASFTSAACACRRSDGTGKPGRPNGPRQTRAPAEAGVRRGGRRRSCGSELSTTCWPDGPALALAATAVCRRRQAQTPDEIIKRGKVVIAIDTTVPPYGMLDATNQPAGIDVDVANAIGKNAQGSRRVRDGELAGPHPRAALATASTWSSRSSRSRRSGRCRSPSRSPMPASRRCSSRPRRRRSRDRTTSRP